MIIKSITQIKDKKDSFAALFDDGTEIKMSAAQIADFGIFSGRELSGDEYEELRASISLSSAKARALRILGSRSLSAREIERRLIGKGVSHETAAQTVEWLKSIGIVNDAEYAASIVSYYSAKAYGNARIRDELFKRGIPRELWDEAMNSSEETGDAAYELLIKKLRGSRDKDELRRAADFLRRRGFSYEEARSAVNNYLEKVEDAEDDEL